jgi:dipeptidyl aminopeptidase/acylaminoacyl peptidase
MRYADAILDSAHNRLIAVREDHTTSAPQAVNTLVGISTTDDAKEQVLITGNDFYSTPRLNPDGTRLIWLTWNHPNMPWDGTELWVAELAPDGSLGESTFLAGGAAESIFQPQWSPDGTLYFISDRTGWWNLYRWNEISGAVEALCPMEAEFGEQVGIGMSTWIRSAGKLICIYCQNGHYRLAPGYACAGFPPV